MRSVCSSHLGPKVAITIATYKRPRELATLLRSLNKQTASFSVEIIVVDNDVAASARSVVLAEAPRATYLIEPQRGISAARNAGVECALQFTPWAIAFIDDDESASPEWLASLASTMADYDADVVTGPVNYVLQSVPTDGKYFQRLVRKHGSQIHYVATNNALVRATWFEPPAGLRFDNSYGLTGGEDLEFFLRLQRAGGSCIWDDHASVAAHVPVERTTRNWILRREMRNGQLIARLSQSFDGYSCLKMTTTGLCEILTGLKLITARSSWGHMFPMPALYRIAAGFGWVRAATGLYYYEYRIWPKFQSRRYTAKQRRTNSAAIHLGKERQA